VSERGLNVTALTRRAIEAAGEGNLDEARVILAEALQLDPKYEPAWLWFAHVAENDQERKFCLQRAAALNEDSKAHAALAKLADVRAVEPAALDDVIDPEPPPTLLESAGAGRRTPWWWWAAGALLLGLAVLGLAWYLNRPAVNGGEPVYVAFAGDLSGPSKETVAGMRDSAQLAFDKVNADGGIGGHPVTMLVFDDTGTPEGAEAVAKQIVADDRIALVIGHANSAESLAAAPIYRDAGLPSITGTSTANSVTAVNPWGFRTIFDNASQGVLIAAGLQQLLGADRVTLLVGSGPYAESLSKGIQGDFDGTIVDTIQVPDEAAIPDAVARVKEIPDTGPIMLAMGSTLARPTIVALRDAGIDAQLLGGDSLGTDAFLRSFNEYPAEQADPGHYTNGLSAVAPIFLDSLSSDALRWLQDYVDAYGKAPTWHGATTADAAIAATHALQAAASAPDAAGRRLAAWRSLSDLDSPATALPGVLGPIWFDSLRTAPRTIAIGVAQDQLYQSGPIQFEPYRPTGSDTLAQDLAAGQVVNVDGNLLQRQRIVFSGINVNEIGDLDLAGQTYQADFFIWFTYTGDDDAIDIQFNNAVNPLLKLGDPVRTVKNGTVTYQLFRVNAPFKAPLEFQDFPFDTQTLPIQFQNRKLPINDIVYVIDRSIIQQSQEDRLRSGVDETKTISDIPNWEATNFQVYRGTVGNTAALGDPTSTSSTQGVEYSTMTTDITIGRDIGAFLVKNLLPLALLALVTYVSLFFSHSQTGARVSFGITGILTGAVLLTEVTSSLPDVGYTVAIEWAYYAFILLSAFCLVIGLLGDKLYEKRRFTTLHKMDIFSRIFYPAFIALVVGLYWWKLRA